MAETLKAMLNDQKLVTTLSEKFFTNADTDRSGLIELKELTKLLICFRRKFDPTSQSARYSSTYSTICL